MKFPAILSVSLFLSFAFDSVCAELSVSYFEKGSFGSPHLLHSGKNMLPDGVIVTMDRKTKTGLDEYALSVTNTHRTEPVRLRFRVTGKFPAGNGIYWDGFEEHSVQDFPAEVCPEQNRYNFPLHAFHCGKSVFAAGLAPWTVCSRFERKMKVAEETGELFFDLFLALAPSESEKVGFVAMHVSESDGYVEAVERVYVNYPDYFRPVAGADPRSYGVGGYFYSSNESREYQAEEARRVNFSWEWYYNCYQKAGDIFPEERFWDSAKGYKTEKSHAACDTPGSVQDWLNYNRNRIASGNFTAALHYYYLQQYCNSDLLKNVYPDSRWIGKDLKALGATHGWAEEGWANYAWPGASSSYGRALREDLAKIWKNFDVAGFALDMTLGDTPYYGDLAIREKGKAFDDQGRIFVA